MYTAKRCIAVLAATIAAACLTACGGSTSGSDETVAQVAGLGSISQATLQHWLPIEARLLYREVPTAPVPEGVIPVPPGYAACIAYLEAQDGSNAATQKPTIAQLRTTCAQRYQSVKEDTLNTLIAWDWTRAEGAALGIKVSDAEVKRRLKEVNSHLFPKPNEFASYLRYTGQNLTDMLLRSEVQLFEVKISERLAVEEKLLAERLPEQQEQAALSKLVQQLPPGKRWVARTSCATGYVTSDCKQYKGSLSPDTPN